MAARRLAVSDVHGEGHRLEAVLKQAQYEPLSDKLYLLGDYIDRGTDSKYTVQFVQELQRVGAVVLMGNHEYMLSNRTDKTEYENWLQNGGRKTISDFGGPVPDPVCQWADALPYYHEEVDAIFVHAGYNPNVPMHRQSREYMVWAREEFFLYTKVPKLTIFGHTPINIMCYGEPTIWRGQNKVCIDTGAAYGGKLTLYDADHDMCWQA